MFSGETTYEWEAVPRGYTECPSTIVRLPRYPTRSDLLCVWVLGHPDHVKLDFDATYKRVALINTVGDMAVDFYFRG